MDNRKNGRDLCISPRFREGYRFERMSVENIYELEAQKDFKESGAPATNICSKVMPSPGCLICIVVIEQRYIGKIGDYTKFTTQPLTFAGHILLRHETVFEKPHT